VSYLTARGDLRALEELGLLRHVQVGREHRFFENGIREQLADSGS
jgi:hypothetical protein